MLLELAYVLLVVALSPVLDSRMLFEVAVLERVCSAFAPWEIFAQMWLICTACLPVVEVLRSAPELESFGRAVAELRTKNPDMAKDNNSTLLLDQLEWRKVIVLEDVIRVW